MAIETKPTAIYISGPITGYPEDNRAAFQAAEQLLRDWYPEARIINPWGLGPLPGDRWQDYLRRDLRLLLECNAVATLPGWQESRGASLEVHIAKEIGLGVRPLRAWARVPA